MSGVENTTYVGGLNQANPEAQDFISQGDDHLKLIKKCLLNTFPGFSRPIDGALFPWSQTPGAISVYAKFIEHTGRIGALEAFISPLHVDGAILRANNNLSDVADPAVARANLGIPAADDVLVKSQNLNDVPDKAAARINLGVPATADVLVKTQNLIDLQDVAIARQNLDVFGKAETFQKNLNLSDVVNTAVARTNLGAAAEADVLLKAQNLADVPDKAVARFNLDVPSNGDLAAAITGALVGLSAVTSVNGLIGDVVLDAADVGAEIAGTAATLDDALAASFNALFGAANGLATLNGSSVIPDAQVPSYVYANLAAFPPVGASGKIYCALDTGKLYTPVAGPAYQEVSAGLSAIASMTMLGNNTGGSAVPTALGKTAVQTLLRNSAVSYSPIDNATYVLPAGTSSLYLGGTARTNVTVDCSSLELGDPPLFISAGANFTGLKVTATGYGAVSANYRVNLLAHQQLFVLKSSSTNLYVAFLPSTWLEEVRDNTGIHSPRSIRAIRVPNESVQGANVDFSIVPRGSGAFALAVADGTAAGGNKRGAYAVDLQMHRAVNTQVASGDDSHIGGGTNNTASGTRATVLNGNSCTASGADSFAGGDSSVSSAQYSFSYGVSHSNAGYAAVAFGYDHTIGSNALGAAAFGASHTLDGRDSSAFGSGCKDNGSWGLHLISGFNGSADYGHRQKANVVWQAVTLNATPTTLTYQNSGTASDTSVLKIGNAAHVIYVKGRVTARKSQAANQVKVWDVVAVVGNIGAGLELLVDTVTEVYESAGATAWTVAAVLDAANRRFSYTVTGEAAVSIDWVCDLDIHYGAIGVT